MYSCKIIKFVYWNIFRELFAKPPIVCDTSQYNRPAMHPQRQDAESRLVLSTLHKFMRSARAPYKYTGRLLQKLVWQKLMLELWVLKLNETIRHTLSNKWDLIW